MSERASGLGVGALGPKPRRPELRRGSAITASGRRESTIYLANGGSMLHASGWVMWFSVSSPVLPLAVRKTGLPFCSEKPAADRYASMYSSSTWWT